MSSSRKFLKFDFRHVSEAFPVTLKTSCRYLRTCRAWTVGAIWSLRVAKPWKFTLMFSFFRRAISAGSFFSSETLLLLYSLPINFNSHRTFRVVKNRRLWLCNSTFRTSWLPRPFFGVRLPEWRFFFFLCPFFCRFLFRSFVPFSCSAARRHLFFTFNMPRTEHNRWTHPFWQEKYLQHL